jgi:hypothetical protein
VNIFTNIGSLCGRVGPPEENPDPSVTITTHIGENPGGFNWNYKKYVVTPATNNWVVQLHGAGEGGPIDGSQINEVELNGYAKRASQGTVFPFNIIAPQGIVTTGVPSWGNVQRGVLTLLNSLGATKVIMTGYSQGGQKSLDFLWSTNSSGDNIWNGHQGLIVGLLIMCGSKSGGQSYNDALDRKLMCVHGSLDTSANSYSDGLQIVNGYNGATPSHPDVATMVTITGGDHSSAWMKGYNPADAIGIQAYDFVLNCFI